MKKAFWKWGAIFLGGTLALGMLAGCNGGESVPPVPPSSAATASAEGGGEPTPAEFSLPYTGEPIHFTAYGPDSSAITEKPDTPIGKAWREEIGNIFLDWELAPSSDYSEKMKVYLASNNMPDVLPVLDFKVTINEYGDTDMFLDFSQYEDYMPNLKTYRESEIGPFMDSILNAKGERLAIMGIQPTDYTGEGWEANKTLLEECGVSIPATFDEFIQAMRDVKAKKPEAVGFQSYWGLGYAQGWIADAMGATRETIYYDAADSQWKFAYREEAALRRELIETMASLYREGLLNPEIATMSGEQENQALADGNWAFYAGYNSSVRAQFKADKVDGGNPMPFEVEAMLPPRGLDGKSHLSISYIHDAIPGWGFVCSSTAEHPELLAAYMDTVVSPFAKDLWNFGLEGVTYDVVDGEKVLRDDIDRDTTGYYSLYEVWTVGMGPDERITRTEDAFYIDQWNKNKKAFEDGSMVAAWQKGVPIFMPEAGSERSSIENDLNTYITEQEAKFIYGNRPLSEWDAYVEEVEKYIDIDGLLKLYREAKTIDISGPRIWQDYVD